VSHIRLLLTNDIFGSFFTRSTSWGCEAGGDALVAMIDALREDAGTTAWVDGGDFSGGGPLAPATDGELSWAAAAALPIDAAVPGNHEFDFGDEVAASWVRRMPFPVVAADLALDGVSWRGDTNPYVDHWVVSAEGGESVAIVGLALPERRGIRVNYTQPDLSAAANRVRDTVHLIGTDHVVLVIHDGVDDPAPGADAMSFRPERMSELCTALSGVVDVVVGGHSLNRHVGAFGSVPYIQPWAFGVEVGIVDIVDGEVSLDTVRVPAPSSESGSLGWSGPGSEFVSELGGTAIGETPTPLTTLRTPASTLGPLVAEGVRALVDADMAIVAHEDTAAGQIALDGCLNWIPAGTVTEAQVYRALPWPRDEGGDGAFVSDLRPEEVGTLIQALTTSTGAAFVATRPTVSGESHQCSDGGPSGGTTVICANSLVTAVRALRRDTGWQPTGVGQRDGLRHALREEIVSPSER
jgi:2',3'-cyclic-nucleotide 2'-phosphodiesterase (5'-nucleotidase family)